MTGESDKLAGKVKEAGGKLTGDAELEGEGKGQQAAGHVEKAAEKVKGAVDGLTGKDRR